MLKDNHSTSQNTIESNFFVPTNGRAVISPSQAKFILENMNYPRQRNLFKPHVATILDCMNSGAWVDWHRIAFAKLGKSFFLVNGQHRMSALQNFKSNLAFSVDVIPVSSEEELHRVYCTFDVGGRGRNYGEILSATGIPKEYGFSQEFARKLYGAALLLEYNFERQYYQQNPKVRNVDYRISLCDKYAQLAKIYYDMINQADRALKLKLMNDGCMAVAMATIKYKPGIAAEFWGGIAKNDGLRKGDPRNTFIADLHSRSMDRGLLSQSEICASVAWNAFFEKRSLKIIKVKQNGNVIKMKILGTPWGK